MTRTIVLYLLLLYIESVSWEKVQLDLNGVKNITLDHGISTDKTVSTSCRHKSYSDFDDVKIILSLCLIWILSEGKTVPTSWAKVYIHNQQYGVWRSMVMTITVSGQPFIVFATELLNRHSDDSDI